MAYRSFHNSMYSAGQCDVGSYQMSGTPFLTGGLVDTNLPNNGEVHIEFPKLTKSFTVINKANTPLFIHFDTRANANVVNHHHYLELKSEDDSFGFDLRCKEVYISMSGSSGTGSFELSAELTGITHITIEALSGSGINS